MSVASGNVLARINAGTVPTPVLVRATSNSYTVIASDRLGNPVPADTAINLVAEGGQVQAIRFTTISNRLSSATSNFQSATPKPADGRVTVLADAASVVLEQMGKTGSIGLLVADISPFALNPVAAGSAITASATSGLAVTVLGSPVPTTLNPSGASVTYAFDDTTASGTITTTVRSPSGLGTVISQTICRNAAPTAPGPCN